MIFIIDNMIEYLLQQVSLRGYYFFFIYKLVKLTEIN